MEDRKPQVSVIVPIYNVERYLGECLDSLAAQTLGNIEIILVDDGSTDGSSAIAEQYAQAHPNFAYHRRQNGGVSRARNFGAGIAQGDYIAFVDADDIVAPTLFERMLATAQRDGSDVVTCNVRRFNSAKTLKSNVHERAFANAPHVCDIASWPALAFDTTMCNKLIRRSFYEAHGLSFPEGMRYEDIPAALALYAYAERVSILLTYGYFWRARETDALSLTQRVDDVEPVLDRLKALRMVDAFFSQHPRMDAAAAAWRRKALEIDVPFIARRITHYDRADAERVLADLLEYVADNADLSLLPQLPIDKEQCVRAAISGDLETLACTVAFVAGCYQTAPAHLEEGGLIAELPDDIFASRRRDILAETALLRTQCLVRGVHSRGSALSVTVWVHAPRLSVPAGSQSAQAWLVDELTGDTVTLPVEEADASALTLAKGTVVGAFDGAVASYDYDGAGFKCIVDLADDAVASALHPGLWHLEVSYRNAHASGSAAVLLAYEGLEHTAEGLAALHAGLRAAAAFDRIGQFSVRVSDEPVTLACATAGQGSVVLAASDADVRLRAVGRLGDVRQSDELGCLELPVCELPMGAEFAVEYETPSGGWRELPCAGKTLELLHVQGCSVAVRSARSLGARVRAMQAAALLQAIDRDEKTLLLDVIRIAPLDASPDGMRMRLVLEDAHTLERVLLGEAVPTEAEDGWRCVLGFEFAKELEAGRLSGGTHRLLVEYVRNGALRKEGDLLCAPGLSRRIRDGQASATIGADDTGRATLSVRKGWSDDASSATKRRLLAAEKYPAYRAKPLDEKLVFFEAKDGACSGSPRALYEYLCENNPDLQFVWTISDGITPLDGPGESTRRGSTKYYRMLAWAKYIVTDCPLDPLFDKREGQVVLQFDPFASEVLDPDEDAAAGEEAGPSAASELWDFVALQGDAQRDAVHRLYPGAYRDLPFGLPSTDMLFADAGAAAFKKRLGLPSGKRAILCIPAESAGAQGFDARAAYAALPEDCVVLLAAGSADTACVRPDGSPLCIDVSQIRAREQLLGCADALVSDDVQALLDFALTGKPMVAVAGEQVSEDAYARELFGSLPCPIVRTVDEAFAAIGSLDTAVARDKAQVKAFRKRFLGYERKDSCKAIARRVFKRSRW